MLRISRKLPFHHVQRHPSSRNRVSKKMGTLYEECVICGYATKYFNRTRYAALTAHPEQAGRRQRRPPPRPTSPLARFLGDVGERGAAESAQAINPPASRPLAAKGFRPLRSPRLVT